MTAERLVDELARALAEPMPRGRALRVLGGALAAVMVPGVRAGAAVAAPAAQEIVCKFGEALCPWDDDKTYRTVDKWYCCGPLPQFQCRPSTEPPKCHDLCPPKNLATGKAQVACHSTAKYPDGRSKRFNCCSRPDSRCDDGECILECSFLFGPGARQCGRQCCPRGAACVDPRTGNCGTCPPPRVCRADCCEPDEKCLDGKCCPRDRTCGSKCCPDGQLCRNGRCCPGPRACGSNCCPRGTKCAFSKGKRICCPSYQAVTQVQKSGKGYRFCCPIGTAVVRGANVVGGQACCSPRQKDCCRRPVLAPGDVDLEPLFRVGQICVDGKTKKL